MINAIREGITNVSRYYNAKYIKMSMKNPLLTELVW